MDGNPANFAPTHGIQMQFVGVKELHFDSVKLPSTLKPEDFEELKFSIGRSPYNREEKTIAVFTKLETESKTADVHLRVELIGQFQVDEAMFPADRVEEWAEKAAFFVLIPFLREHFYSLSIRLGLPHMIMPLVTVPTFSVVAPQSEQAVTA